MRPVKADRYAEEKAAKALVDLAQNTRFASLYYLCCLSAAVLWAPQLVISDGIILFISASYVVIGLLRELACRAVLNPSRSTFISSSYQLSFCIVISAFLWSVLALYLMQSVESFNKDAAVFVVLTAGMAASGAISIVPFFSIIVAIVVCLLLIPALSVLFVFDVKTGGVLSFMLLLFSVFLIHLGRKLCRSYWQMLDTNISLRVKTEELKLVSVEAINASETKSRFLANISHEIRTPMNGILGVVDLMGYTPLNDEQKNYLKIIRDSGTTLQGIIDDVLDFSKLEANKVSLHLEPVNIKQLVKDIHSLFLLQLRSEAVQLNYDIDEQVPEWVRLDGQRIRQVLYNLLGNAFKFTQQGAITLTLNVTEAEDSQPCLQIEVSDTGIGIDAGHLEAIFSEFEQVDSKPNVKGTGLGLAISKKLVALMGGQLYVRSQPGVGSTFGFRIPCVAEHKPAQTLVTETKVPDQLDLTILVAEDDKVNMMIASTLLETWGCKVLTAVNGREALACAQQHRPDLILMDCGMPEMDGFAATRAIRQWEQEHQHDPVPILALTAHVIGSSKQQCLDAGMNDYLSKPIASHELKSKLAVYASTRKGTG